MSRPVWKLLSALSAIAIAIVLTTGGCSGECTADKGCFPPLGDLILGRDVDVTSSCMEGESYNLSGEVMMCDSLVNSTSFITDNNGDNTTWVSGRISSDDNETLPFFIEVNFEAPVLFYSTNIVWKSRVPAALVLERNNGSNWVPYRYYANNCEYYDLADTAITPLGFKDQEPVCTTMETNLFPGSEVPFNTSSHINKTATPADVALGYRTITGLRIVVDAIFEGALFGELSDVIAISEWTTVGTCICNGHADMCLPIGDEPEYSGKAYAGCECSHNTTGTNCDSCATGFNDQEWAPGNETDANECKACQCNEHASDCYYNTTIMSSICIDCQHNTEGYNCSSCQDMYYPDPSRSVTDPDYCTECNCNEIGTIDGDRTCSSDGECNCKANVALNQCLHCLDGYWNLTQDNPNGCQECDCGEGTELSGDVKRCNADTGMCQCKSDKVVGERCDSCIEGRYDLSNGCSKECLCIPAASINSSCDPIEGWCYCIDNVNGITCNIVESGYYYKTLDDITLEAEETSSINELTLITPIEDQDTFSGSGFLLVPSTGATIVFSGVVDITANYFIVIRYKSSEDITGVTVAISDSVNSRRRRAIDIESSVTLLASERSEPILNDITDQISASIPLNNNTQYQITVEYSPTQQTAHEWMIDSVVLLPDVAHESVGFSCLPLSLPVAGGCDLTTFELSITFHGQVFSCDEEPNRLGLMNLNQSCPSHGQIYSCSNNYTGPLCDQCSNGYYNNSGVCEECPNLCNSTGAVNAACNLQIGSCDCRDNVTGDACDTCAFGHYNLTTDGCTDCRCYGNNQTCNKEGECDCHPTTLSPKCDSCINGYYNLTSDGCTSCNCNANPYASNSSSCNTITGQCECIGNAVGLQCTECPSTHYNTSGSTAGQDHCMECFCFGLTSECSPSNQDYTLTSVVTDFTTVAFCGGESCSMGWVLYNIQFILAGFDGMAYQITDEDNPVFISPDEFHGDFKLAYGRNIVLQFMITTDIDNVHNNYVSLSNGDVTIYAHFNNYTVTDMDYTFNIPLVEDQWRVNSLTGDQASLSVFIDVLSNVTDFRFTGEFSDNIVMFNYLKMVRLEYIVPVTSLPPDTPAENTYISENCSCPQGHLLPFCDECIEGYYREIDSLVEPCLQCQCNGLATLCETPTGICINCTGNTTGDHCEQCMSGFYGDPKNNVPCVPCDCSGIDTTCNNITGVCEDCGEGYRGTNCESCDNGYYYNMGGICTPCSCDDDNVDKSVDPYCDPITGECLNCTGNTEGFNCDKCINGYYNNSNNRSLLCEACDCDLDASMPAICNNATGLCFCIYENAVSNCSVCKPGYYGDPKNNTACLPCDCNGFNSTCNSMGMCDECAEGYRGDNCESCLNGYYNLTDCTPCSCNNVDKSVDPYCDPATGQCLNCTDNTEGFNCDKCIHGYYNNSSNSSLICEACDCDPDASLPGLCDNTTGLCICKDSNASSDCSECRPGYYGNLTNGEPCIQCPPCPLTNNSHASTCSLKDGNVTCDCPKQYTGNNCEECAKGYFGDPVMGICNDCQCNGNIDPANGSYCDMITGFCMNCLNNTHGGECENCDNGYYGNPAHGIACKPCMNCSENGTKEEICDMVSGKCLCRDNVAGDNCSECMEGMFGAPDEMIECKHCSEVCLNVDNPICHLSEEDLNTPICDNCGPVYSGSLCQDCGNGYWNDSNVCVPCECNGNVDTALGLVCHPDNGTCLNCLNNTTGDYCDQCAIGYYGDISKNVSCKKCSCDEYGVTDAVCNSTTGECFCKPSFNSSTDCNSCDSGYWRGDNDSDSCKPCNCCDSGSVSMECNQMTGECSCLPGVNGLQCCQCKEDHYNMTDTGCTACNCSSALSLNQSCNDTGHCYCKEGAVGKKCDECDSFGYFGTAPDCMRCHDCFFLWNDILTDTSENVSYLLAEVQTILDYYGTETDEESVRNAIKMVEATINSTNETLRMISIDAQLLVTINATLQKVLMVQDELVLRVNSLSSSINSTVILMDKVTAFMGIMESEIEDLDKVHENITALVTLAKSLQSEAIQSSQAIAQNQLHIAALQATVDMLSSNVSISQQSLEWSLDSSNTAHTIAMMAKTVAMEISAVNTEFMAVEKKFDEFEFRLSEEESDLEQLVEELWMLDQTLTQFNNKLSSISVLSQALLDSTEAIETRTANLLTDIDLVTVASNNTLASAQMLAAQVGVAQEEAAKVAGNLAAANQSAQQLNQIPVPSISDALNIAQSINNTIVESEDVDDVLKDANETAIKARDFMERAHTESARVGELQDLVDSIETDRNYVSETIGEIDETLSDITEDIEDIEDTLNKVEENSIASTDIEDQQMKISYTESGLAAGSEKLQTVTEDAKKALDNSTTLKSTVTEESGKIDTEVSNLNKLKMDAIERSADSVSDLNKASQAQTMADSSKTEANTAPSLQELQDMLVKYKKKLEEVNSAKHDMERLSNNLDEMVSTFNERSEKYKNCYKTP